MHVAGESQRGQVVEKGRLEYPLGGQPGQLRGAEAQLLEVVERLLQPRGQIEVATGRQLSSEELEHRGLGHAALEVPLQHGQLVEVGKQHAGGGESRGLGGHRRLRLAVAAS